MNKACLNNNKSVCSIILAYLQKLVLNKLDFLLQGLQDY
jgi:hypothetical protein